MREIEPVQGDESAEGAAAEATGTLVVLSPKYGPIAKATMWLVQTLEGQKLLAVPVLRVEHHAALLISGGMGLGELFHNCRLVAPDWDEPAGFVGGSWQLWKASKPELQQSGFVVGSHEFNIERAVRGLRKLLA